MLEFPEERHERPAKPLLRDGPGTKVRQADRQTNGRTDRQKNGRIDIKKKDIHRKINRKLQTDKRKDRLKHRPSSSDDLKNRNNNKPNQFEFNKGTILGKRKAR